MQEEGKLLAALQAEYKAADRGLNTTYKLLAIKMDGVARAKLVKAQRAWLAFRDANAVLHADYLRSTKGLGGDIALYTMLAQMTMARIKELDDIGAQRDAAKKP